MNPRARRLRRNRRKARDVRLFVPSMVETMFDVYAKTVIATNEAMRAIVLGMFPGASLAPTITAKQALVPGQIGNEPCSTSKPRITCHARRKAKQ